MNKPEIGQQYQWKPEAKIGDGIFRITKISDNSIIYIYLTGILSGGGVLNTFDQSIQRFRNSAISVKYLESRLYKVLESNIC